MLLWVELSQPGIRSPECFSANCFQMLVLETIPTVSLLENSHLTIHLWSRILSLQEVFLIPFLTLSGRIVYTNSKLLRRYWALIMNDSESELCVWSIHFEVYCVSVVFRIPRLKALIVLNTGRPVSLNRSTTSVAVESNFLSSPKRRVSHHFFSSQGPRNVQCPCEIFSQKSKHKFHPFLFLPKRCRWTLTWRLFGLWIFQNRCSIWKSWRICNNQNPGKIFHSNSLAYPSTPSNSW